MLLVVNDSFDYCLSYFLKEKSDLKDHIIEQIKELDSKHNYKVKYICCDNSDDIISLEKACKQEGLGVTCEYTALELLSRKGKWNGNLQLYTVKLELCSMEGILIHQCKLNSGPKLHAQKQCYRTI